MDANALTQLEVQVAIPLLVGLVGIGLELLRRKFNLQADSTANAAIQNAVGNFAGKVAGDLSAGTMSAATALPMLKAHLGETVADSLARLPVSDAALTTMLLGKAAAVAGVSVPVVTAQ